MATRDIRLSTLAISANATFPNPRPHPGLPNNPRLPPGIRCCPGAMENSVHGEGDAAAIMAPLGVHCLGWFCLAYHVTDAPARPAAIQRMLIEVGIVTEIDRAAIEHVLASVLRKAPWLITTERRIFLAIQPRHPPPCATLVVEE